MEKIESNSNNTYRQPQSLQRNPKIYKKKKFIIDSRP